MGTWQEDREIYFNLRYSFIFDHSFEKHIKEEYMPDFRKWGLSQYVINEYIDKVSEHSKKWSFDGQGIEGLVGKWCLYIGWIICGGLGALLRSWWGLVLGFLLMVGVYHLVCRFLHYTKRKERNIINNSLIENYLEEYRTWLEKNYPHL